MILGCDCPSTPDDHSPPDPSSACSHLEWVFLYYTLATKQKKLKWHEFGFASSFLFPFRTDVHVSFRFASVLTVEVGYNQLRRVCSFDILLLVALIYICIIQRSWKLFKVASHMSFDEQNLAYQDSCEIKKTIVSVHLLQSMLDGRRKVSFEDVLLS